MTDNFDPLVAPPPPEVPLAHAPLVRVIAQLRFPTILALEQREFVVPFQEAIRATYPVLRQEQAQSVMFGSDGMIQTRPQVIWRFSDSQETWRVSLSSEFLALETTRYESRKDLVARIRVLASALCEHVEPAQLDRLGIRYIDRITGEAVDNIGELVRAEVRGIAGTIAATHALHSVTESLFNLDDAKVLARWGRLPAGTTVDPMAIEPMQEQSWILDLDMFSATPIPFRVDAVVAEAERYAARIYTIFRWAVTKQFLVRYGGKL